MLLRHCFEQLQHCSSIAMLCCAKNRRCESSRVTSPLSKLYKFGSIERHPGWCRSKMPLLNPFAPEPPVTARADSDPFYPS